jgi:hypothetical protein
MNARPPAIEGGAAGSDLTQSLRKEQLPALRQFDVTVVTTRCGTTTAIIAAEDRDSALTTVRGELEGGDFTAPPEHCTDDVQTEIWTIRELQ